MPWPCVLLLETDQASVGLRRYANAPCSAQPYGMGIHDARVPLTMVRIALGEGGTWDVVYDQPPHTDERWPQQCACGYVFQESDRWQLTKDRLYMVPETGELLTLQETKPGMMWNATWLADIWHGEDGRCLSVRLPDGTEWVIDSPSTNGSGWTRDGEPPLLNVTPSILSKGYHGYLTNGVLTDDTEGRRY